MHFLFSSTLYPSPRSSNCFFFLLYFCYINKNFKKGDPCQTWVKISKVMPQPKSISPGKGREALWQKFQIFRFQICYGLTVHIRFYIYKHNFSKFCLSVKSYSELHKIRSIRPKYPAPFNNTLCFRHLPRQRKLRNSSELRKFHAVCPHSP